MIIQKMCMKGMDKKENGKEFSDFSIQCNIAINEYTNSTGHMQDNVKDLESNKKKSKNDIWQLQQPENLKHLGKSLFIDKKRLIKVRIAHH